MRQQGYRIVDLLVDRLLADGPPLQRATPAEMRERLGGPPPAEAQPLEAVFERLADDVLPFRSRVDHPRFLAFIPGSGTWPGALADFVASACNVYAGSWMESAGPSQVELEVLGWFKAWVGYPAEAAGSLTSGGSAANMTALACAREAKAGAMRDDLVLYASDQAHSSIARAARLLGFRPDQVRVLPTENDLRLAPESLAAAIEADLRAGRSPLAVTANAGSTNTGITDPLPELAEVCRKHGVWLHVDAAYGGFAVLSERGREQLRGLELADSLTLDPHKWLYQPFECGCVLVRDGRLLRSAFELVPDYLSDARATDEEANFSDLGLQLTRTSRALKVWVSLQAFGLDAFRAAITRRSGSRRATRSSCWRRRRWGSCASGAPVLTMPRLRPRWRRAASAWSRRRDSTASSRSASASSTTRRGSRTWTPCSTSSSARSRLSRPRRRCRSGIRTSPTASLRRPSSPRSAQRTPSGSWHSAPNARHGPARS
jgi:glutamate/tyrosine decarboxylase-like PLP-dependent enzyme